LKASWYFFPCFAIIFMPSLWQDNRSDLRAT